ncbi:hypothetical protein EC991_010068 [Linnemannia zychae]|nr:hypothetical protein EC991_010068 [Linnemannia zychae]
MIPRPDPERAVSPPPLTHTHNSRPRASLDHYAPRSSTSRAHPRQSEDRSLPPIHHVDISSSRSSTDITNSTRILQNLFPSDPPVNDNNPYAGPPALDQSRRYSTSLSSKRRSGQTPTLAATPESFTLTRSSTGGFHTSNPDFQSSQDGDSINTFPLTPGPLSPSFSISSLSNIIPISNSISSITSVAPNKPPVLEHRHPISVKDFESIHLLGPNQKTAIKTLCSSRVLSRIDTIGWFSILGAQKFPTISTSQEAYDIEMATTCMAIEFGVNNTQTQNFNTLVLQLLSQIKLIKDQEYKGDIPSHAYNALFLTRVFLNHFISHLSTSQMISFFEGKYLYCTELSTDAQQEALGVVSFKGCKLGVDQSLVTDPRPYAEQLIQGVIGIILNMDVGSSPSAYEFYQETLNLFIVMASTQLQLTTSETSEKNYFLNLVLDKFRQIHCEEVCLLLHVLLVENTYFRTYVLSRTDPETLYLPILRMVYEGVEGKTNYSQVYVLLVILLLFSQDDVFNDSIQKITMTYQPWFTERLLKSISLGGLAVAIVIRTIQYNLAQHKDVYFHTNSLAILANMSNSLQDIHPYVSQRLVTLFDIVARRYQKLVTKKLQQDEIVDKNPDVIIYGDMVTLVLEIINSTLTHKLKANPQLVYSLLHKQEMFAYFRNDVKFKDLIQNIEQAVNYFQQKVSEANINPPTPEEVAQVIQTASRTWPPNLMKTFPDIKFQYEEEEQANEFFCPYVWSLLYRNTFVYWDEEKAKILHDYRTVMNDEHAFEGVPTGGPSTVS